MLSNGVTGKSYSEISKAIGLCDYSVEDLNTFNKKMIAGLQKADEGADFISANSIWSNKQISLKKNFIDTNKAFYGAKCQSVDFTDPSTVNMMNQWCSESTNGKIDKFINKTNGTDLLYIANALYFSAKWKNEFDESNTKEGVFTSNTGEQRKGVFMNRKTNEAYYDNNLFTTTTVTYGNGAYYMQLILPKENITVVQLLDKLKEPGYWAECKAHEVNYAVNLSLPKFNIDGEEAALKDFLKELGIQKIFEPSSDFSLMTDAVAGISKINQKTHLSIDEKGSEAATVTYTDIITSPGTKPLTVSFTANRPFLFAICESSTNAFLFIGVVSKL